MTKDERSCTRFAHARFSSVRSALGEDIVRFATFHPDYRPDLTVTSKLSIMLQPTLLCLLLYRLSHYFWLRRWHAVARLIAGLNCIVFKANIPAHSCIGPGCFMGHTLGTTFIGTAGRDLTIFAQAVCFPRAEVVGDATGRGPRLGDGVRLGAQSSVVGDVHLGDGTAVAPRTRVAEDCPPGSLAVSARLRHRATFLRRHPILEEQSPVADASQEQRSEGGEIPGQIEGRSQEAKRTL